MSESVLIRTVELLAAAVGFVAAFRPGFLPRTTVRAAAAVVVVIIVVAMAIGFFENRQVVRRATSITELLKTRSATIDEIQETLGDMSRRELLQGLIEARERHWVADSVLDLRAPEGRFMRVRVYFRTIDQSVEPSVP